MASTSRSCGKNHGAGRRCRSTLQGANGHPGRSTIPSPTTEVAARAAGRRHGQWQSNSRNSWSAGMARSSAASARISTRKTRSSSTPWKHNWPPDAGARCAARCSSPPRESGAIRRVGGYIASILGRGCRTSAYRSRDAREERMGGQPSGATPLLYYGLPTRILRSPASLAPLLQQAPDVDIFLKRELVEDLFMSDIDAIPTRSRTRTRNSPTKSFNSYWPSRSDWTISLRSCVETRTASARNRLPCGISATHSP